jgi:hypothetical protein
MDKSQLMQMAESEEATPKEQQEYEQAFESIMTSLHSGQVAKNTVARVLNAKSTVEGVAEASFVLIRRTEEQLGGLSDAVKVQIAEDVINEILGLMVESGRLSEGEINDKMVENIVSMLYMMYTQDADKRGALNVDAIQQDLASVGQKPQGMNAMSNQEVQTRGLMNV